MFTKLPVLLLLTQAKYSKLESDYAPRSVALYGACNQDIDCKDTSSASNNDVTMCCEVTDDNEKSFCVASST